MPGSFIVVVNGKQVKIHQSVSGEYQFPLTLQIPITDPTAIAELNRRKALLTGTAAQPVEKFYIPLVFFMPLAAVERDIDMLTTYVSILQTTLERMGPVKITLGVNAVTSIRTNFNPGSKHTPNYVPNVNVSSPQLDKIVAEMNRFKGSERTLQIRLSDEIPMQPVELARFVANEGSSSMAFEFEQPLTLQLSSHSEDVSYTKEELEAIPKIVRVAQEEHRKLAVAQTEKLASDKFASLLRKEGMFTQLVRKAKPSGIVAMTTSMQETASEQQNFEAVKAIAIDRLGKNWFYRLFRNQNTTDTYKAINNSQDFTHLIAALAEIGVLTANEADLSPSSHAKSA